MMYDVIVLCYTQQVEVIYVVLGPIMTFLGRIVYLATVALCQTLGHRDPGSPLVVVRLSQH